VLQTKKKKMNGTPADFKKGVFGSGEKTLGAMDGNKDAQDFVNTRWCRNDPKVGETEPANGPDGAVTKTRNSQQKRTCRG